MLNFDTILFIEIATRLYQLSPQLTLRSLYFLH